MLTICFEEEGIISGCVSESGYVEFHLWEPVWTIPEDSAGFYMGYCAVLNV